MKLLFENHIQKRFTEVQEILQRNSLDVLFIESGYPDYYFLDDQPTFFKPNPHFNFFCPDQNPGHLLKLSVEDSKPRLYFNIPTDFWHEVASLQNCFWEASFDVEVVADIDLAWLEAQEANKRCAVLAPQAERGLQKGCQMASEKIVCELNWLRGQKTDYEIHCIQEANRIASLGHQKAKSLFLEGAPEWDIYMGFLLASGQRESEIPYNSIVALDGNSAVLHYQTPKKGGAGQTFLIDAGARIHGYCSDITRTYTQDSVDEEYKDLIQKIQGNKEILCKMVKPRCSYIEIHRRSYIMVAELLVDHGFFKGSVEEAIDKKIPFVFYPHGVGHPLGLQVHDVGAKQKTADGERIHQPEDFPHLRTLRDIQERDVLTIEPGFYFIPMLLKTLRDDPSIARLLNWDKISAFIPFGGIRIEDNVVARDNGPENITRAFLA